MKHWGVRHGWSQGSKSPGATRERRREVFSGRRKPTAVLFFYQKLLLERRPAKICRINILFRKKLPCPWGFDPAEPQDVVLKKVGPQIASRGVNQA